MKVVEIDSPGSISRSGMKELDYCLNPYLGCHHGCRYCYAPDMTSAREASENWGEVIYVRKNIDKNLARDIKNIRRGTVGISTITDPYQAVEGRYRLTGKCLSILLGNGFRVTIQTRSPLARLDFPILAAHRNMADIGFTLISMDMGKTRIFEPHTPSPDARIRAVREAGFMGIPTWIYFGPIMRGINDSPDDIRRILSEASIAGARVIYDFYQDYKAPHRMTSAAGLKPSRLVGDAEWRESTSSIIHDLAERLSVKVNSEGEEWLMEKRDNFRTLF